MMDKRTILDVYEDDVKFKRITMVDTSKIISISDIRSVSLNQLITVKAKVCNLSGKKKVHSLKDPLTKVNGQLVDPTGSIPIVLWETFTEAVEEGKTYIFRNLRVKTDYLSKELCVNTAKSGCSIEETRNFNMPLAKIQALPSDMTDKSVDIEIIGVSSAINYRTCHLCHKKVRVKDKIATCTSCNLVQKISATNVTWILKLVCHEKESGEDLQLTLFNEAVKQLFNINKSKINLSCCTPSDIQSALLSFDDMNVMYNIKNKAITDILYLL